jgi:uncharacterized protein (TIGR02145 family)
MGKLWCGGTVVGEVDFNGNVWIGGSVVGKVDSDGKVWRGECSIGNVDSNGRIWYGGRTIGSVGLDGRVWRGESVVGSVDRGKFADGAALIFFGLNTYTTPSDTRRTSKKPIDSAEIVGNVLGILLYHILHSRIGKIVVIIVLLLGVLLAISMYYNDTHPSSFASGRMVAESNEMANQRVRESQGMIASVERNGSFIDKRDGRTYKTIKIGNHTWMAENLNYQPQSGGSRCYNDSSSYCDKYGRLYDWKTAINICPMGWHLASRQEWNNLVTNAGGYIKEVSGYKMVMSGYEVVGKKLKAKRGWITVDGTDDFGFSALPSGDGAVSENGGIFFSNGGNGCSWWTSAEYSENAAYCWFITYYHGDADYTNEGYGHSKDALYSVRCVQN